MASVNAELRDLLISHQIGLQRLTNREVKDMLALLDRAERDIRAVLKARLQLIASTGKDGGPLVTRRIEQLLAEIHAMRKVAILDLYAPLADDLEEFALYEQGYLTRSLRSTIPSRIPFEPALASTELLRSIVRSQPFQGKLLYDHFRALVKRNGLVARRMKELIEEGLATGAPPVTITRRVSAQALGITRANVQAIVQTSMSHVTNSMRDQFTQDNTDVIKATQWVGTLDSRLCSICLVRDGHTYDPVTHAPLDGGPPWGDGPGRMHWNDRCTPAPVLKSWEELGIDAKELTGEQRASMDGFVDADTTAEQWVGRQSYERLSDMFGPRRADLLTSGGLDISDLVRTDGTLITLEELRNSGVF